MLARARSHPSLVLLLAGLLAWPSSLPVSAVGADSVVWRGSSTAAVDVAMIVRTPEPTRHSSPIDWSVDADDPEELDGPEGPRTLVSFLPQRPVDLPSLVPSSVESTPVGTIETHFLMDHFPPLRC